MPRSLQFQFYSLQFFQNFSFAFVISGVNFPHCDLSDDERETLQGEMKVKTSLFFLSWFLINSTEFIHNQLSLFSWRLLWANYGIFAWRWRFPDFNVANGQ